MVRKLRRRELSSPEESTEEITQKENVVENEPINIDLKVSGEELDEVVEEPVEEPKEVNFEFQETYFLGTPNTDEQVSIDALPEPVIEASKPQRTIESLSRAEFRIYQRTGKIPN